MAEAACRVLGSDVGIGITGVAGPDEQEGRPVGTVWVAAAGPTRVESRLLALPGDRPAIRQATCDRVLALVEDLMREEGPLR
jgi:nicotinamide mononucleotide (NMN) deamidase PncC